MPLLPQTRWKRVLLGFLICFIAISCIDQIWVWNDRRITISHDTTRITAPIVVGYPDYLASLNEISGKDVTPDNNAAPLILEIIGTGDAPPSWTNAVYRTWSLPMPSAKPLFTDYPAWTAKQPTTRLATLPRDPAPMSPYQVDLLDDEIAAACKNPWSPTDHPQVARWLQTCRPALNRLQLACQRPKFFVPSTTDDGLTSDGASVALLSIHYHWLDYSRPLARAAIARAMMRLRQTDLDGFEQDILTAFRLSRLISQQPTLIECLVALAIDAQANAALQQAAASNLLDEAHVKSLRDAIDAIGPFPSFSGSCGIAERYMLLDAVCSVHRNGFGEGVAPNEIAKVWLQMVPLNYDAVMREANGYYDRMAAAFDLPTYSQRQAVFLSIEKELEPTASAGFVHRVFNPGEIFITTMMPSFMKASEIHTSNLVNRDLALTALALRAFKLRAGNYPETLADLKSPTFDPPLDRFTDTPLIYRRKGDGYLLYSVGPNLKDDGGIPRGKGTGKNFDIVVETP